MQNPNDIQMQINDMIKAFKDQRENALDAVANLNVQVAQLKRVVEFQGQSMIAKDAEIERLRAFEPAPPSSVDEIAQKIDSKIDGKERLN